LVAETHNIVLVQEYTHEFGNIGWVKPKYSMLYIFYFGGVDPEYIANMFSAEALDTNVTFAIAIDSG